MTLAPGTTLGSNQIEASLGAPASGDLARAGLLGAPGFRPLPHRLFLVPISEPNAFAVPPPPPPPPPGGGGGGGGGDSTISSPRLDWPLALGHELGHHQARHTLKRTGRALVFSVARALLSGAHDTSLIDRSVAVADSSYSRRQER